MRRWSVALLGIVGLFVALVGTLLVVRGRGLKADQSELPPSVADYRLKEILLREESRQGTRWLLQADQAEVFEQAGRTSLKRIVISVEEKDRTWKATGDEGDITEGTKDVELRGNVVVQSSDGLKLETSRLHWDGKAERVWTDDAVTVSRPGLEVKGRGLEVKVDEQSLSMSGRVRAVLTPGAVGQREAGR
jgi:LPS export ABC transporter protein LptC